MAEVILLLKNPKTKESKDFKTLVEAYEEKQFKINLFEDYDNNVGLNDYYSLANYLNKKNLSEHDLVTDDYVLLLSWFRLYHNLFRNFVLLFQDKVSTNLEQNSIQEKSFYSKLLEQNGLSMENLHKDIFINISLDNYSEVFGKMLKFTFYFKLLSEFMPEYFSANVINNKRYFLNKREYIDFTFDKTCSEFYDVHLEHDDFIFEKLLSINNNIKISVYLLYFVWKNSEIENSINITNYIISNNNDAKKQNFINEILESLERLNDLVFIKKINLLFTLLYSVKQRDEIVKKIWSLVNEDNTDIFRHQNILKNLNVMMFRKEIKADDIYYQYIRKGVLKITEQYKKLFDAPLKNKLSSNRMVILIDQLLGKYHAPTKVLMKLCNQLLENTEYQIDIIVEENLIPSSEEKYATEYFVANPSKQCKEEHKQYFSNKRVKIFYSDPEKSRMDRVKEQIEIIKDRKPEIIFSLSSFSIVQNLLYTNYPIVYYSFGMEYSPGLANLYLYKNQKRALEIEKLGDGNETSQILYFINDPIFHESDKEIKRENLSLKNEDFVIITVGNRLNTEIDNELLKNIIPLLTSDKTYKWLIVSPELPKSIISDYGNLLGTQIIHIHFEEDLLALTKICDVFLNPNRVGGGYSVSVAMKVGIPVLTTTFESDGLIAVGRENSSGDTYEDLILELTKLRYSTDYWRSKREAMFRRIEEREGKSSIEQLIEYFESIKDIL